MCSVHINADLQFKKRINNKFFKIQNLPSQAIENTKTANIFETILHFSDTIIEGYTIEMKIYVDYNCETTLAVAKIVHI